MEVLLRGSSYGKDSESKIILLIEDNTDDERLTLRALRRNNIMNEVVVAYDGQHAVDYLFAHGTFAGRDIGILPAVVILDLKLPRLSGLQVLEQIRATPSTKHLPVVVLTSSEYDSQIAEAYRRGANSFVRKPQEPAEFSEMILQVAMYWLLLNCTVPERA
jgi:CheY-like chemotaxis protein